VLLVNPKLPVSTVPDFIAHLKANPGKLNHGASSATTILLSEYFKYMAKVDYVNVNYRGGAHVVKDALAGVVQFCFSDLSSALPAIESKQLKPLAVTTLKRFELVPNIPPLSEHLPGFSMDGGILLLAPAKIPRPVLDKLNGVVLQALGMQDVRDRIRSLGSLPGGGSPEQVRDGVQIEFNRWAKLIKERDIRFGR
jgi:tripartite-type tricarboxylate transporter receptor subunit TctC